MHFFSQTSLIHQVRINITIIRSRVNKNIKNSITELTFHLNNGCLAIHLLVIKCFIYLRNALSNIPNHLCLLSTIDLRPTTLIQWKILPAMILATYPTLKRPTTYVLLLSRLRPMSLLNCIKLLVRRNILFLIYTLWSFPLWWPLTFSLFISFPTLATLDLML